MSIKPFARMQSMVLRAQKSNPAATMPGTTDPENAMPANARSATGLLIGLLSVLGMLAVPISATVLNINYDYTLRTVALGGAILGIVSGVLGCFLVLRQQSLLGDALSHAALPGVALAFLLAGKQLGVLLIGAGAAGWLGAMFISAVLRTTRIKQDTAMGITLTAWFAFGLALIGYIQGRPDASQAGLKTFIFGQAAAIVANDVLLISAVGVAAFVMLALFWKEFKLITFDPEFAATNGYPTRLLDVLLTSLTVIAIVLGLQMAGVVLMVGLLIAPAVAARQWTRELGQMIALSAAFGAFAGASGAILSAVSTGMPTGPLIIVVATLIVFFSIMVAPERGILWKRLRDRRNRKTFGEKQAEGVQAWNSLRG